MSKKWLLLDCNYLCHRAKHSTGGLSYGGSATGVIYGFLKEVEALKREHKADNFIFCWDYGKINIRTTLFKEYKANRYKAELTEEEIIFEKAFRKQMKLLRTEYLQEIGYSNIFYQKGYESDDIMASICNNIPEDEEIIIVSADKDLYQLIAFNISFFNPHKNKFMTLQGLKKEYGITPNEWKLVKCLAGCSSDGVPGIKGVGEKTAIKYIKNELNTTSKTYQKIEQERKAIIKKNKPLVVLPFEGTNMFSLKQDNFSQEGWDTVVNKLGMKSLRSKGSKNDSKKRKFF